MSRRLALAAGPALFLLALVIHPVGGMSLPAWHVAGLAVWMAVWWLSAVVPLEATALLPIVVLPLVGTRPIGEVTASYADPIIFLFLGGFLLGATLERWGLHRRFAIATVRRVGTNAPRVVLAFMIASATASMWISNTATAIMMLPVAQAIVSRPAAQGDAPPTDRPPTFATALMLGIAYACSIGGVATLIGTPPNAILAGTVNELLHRQITFAGWLVIGVPVGAVMLSLCWLWLVKLYGVRGEVPGLDDVLARQRTMMDKLSGGERFVLGVFAVTAAAWILRAPKSIGALRIPGLTDVIPGVTDPMIAIAAALLLFVIPLPKSRFPTALDWKSARAIPWGILLLFGGGLALAAAFQSSGLSDWIGGRLVSLRGVPLPIVIAVTTAVFVFLTELTSNTATAALGMPLMAGVAQGLGVAALPLMAAAALAASMAFMLPVATPPNAILYGSGAIKSGDMARAGLGLNFIAIAVVAVAVWLWAG